MKLRDRIIAFSDLGKILSDAMDGKPSEYGQQLLQLTGNQYLKNPWFTPENVRMAVRAIAGELTFENLTRWTSSYPALTDEECRSRVAVIMAGNIPLVGFHDFLCVLISGNSILAKTSSKDADLIKLAGDILCDLNPSFRNKIEFTDGILSGFDSVIATGSDNSSRYFEYYFGKYPGIIRKNRNSIALIGGNETADDLEALGNDVFSYFGLGCRNVSMIYVPEGYDFSPMIKSWSRFVSLINHTKYANNYDYHKAVYMVNRDQFKDTGYLLMKEEKALSSPVAVLYYRYYKSMESVLPEIDLLRDRIQCIVGRGHTPFGESQKPALWDYADGVDTLDFLLKKNHSGIL